MGVGRGGLFFCGWAGYNETMATETTSGKQMKKRGGAVDAVQAAAEYGIDVGQLRDNLVLSVAERLRRHQIALNAVEKLRKAKRL